MQKASSCMTCNWQKHRLNHSLQLAAPQELLGLPCLAVLLAQLWIQQMNSLPQLLGLCPLLLLQQHESHVQEGSCSLYMRVAVPKWSTHKVSTLQEGFTH